MLKINFICLIRQSIYNISLIVFAKTHNIYFPYLYFILKNKLKKLHKVPLLSKQAKDVPSMYESSEHQPLPSPNYWIFFMLFCWFVKVIWEFKWLFFSEIEKTALLEIGRGEELKKSCLLVTEQNLWKIELQLCQLACHLFSWENNSIKLF